jgi:hypothetical protein
MSAHPVGPSHRIKPGAFHIDFRLPMGVHAEKTQPAQDYGDRY